MYFSPRKFLTSTRDPFSVIAQLIGKRAYTARILYLYPLTTPVIALPMMEQMVRMAAFSLRLPKCFSTTKVVLSVTYMSTGRCLKLRTNVPLGPLTVTIRAFTLTSHPSSTVTLCFAFKSFIFLLLIRQYAGKAH